LRILINNIFIAPYDDILCITDLTGLIWTGGRESCFITSFYVADIPAEFGGFSRIAVLNCLSLLVRPNYVCLDGSDSA
jgi:hypothetical protein